ncbi:adenosine deaminase [Actibacterium sp. 188UL27-1]|uniref:adenosine deaminase n=1 Tax=Actibacterium sp. 188UL27-1 TaxID=2786961 RepID=UPI001957B7C4|nr:adenosine deaminase [Actibacterium sp. 188UL27-1]MBM7067371.1 adenosine deaminase [Actibacterium sp. 188UL27-1]
MTDIPKIELHLHLEGAAPPAFIRGLAAEKGIGLDGVFTEDGRYAHRDFAHFLQVYEAATGVLQTPRDFARLTTEVLENCAEHGVIYAETFLSPDFCGGGDLSAWRDYLAAMQEAADGMVDIIQLRGIVTCIRHFGPEKAKPIATCAAETAGDFITGFGMGGAEDVGHPSDYAWAFDCAREAGLRLTTHAGEWGGPASVRDSLDHLKVERIGHGVRAIEDPALVERLAAESVVLEVCPGSNISLGVYPQWSDHPIETLRAAGVLVTVSTDDPPFFDTTMTREYERLSETFGWDEDVFTAVNRVAARAAFCDEATREALLKRLDAT